MELARWRAAHYKDVTYDIGIRLEPKSEMLDGQETIYVTIDNPSDDLIIDWRILQSSPNRAPDVTDIVVNGKSAPVAAASDHLLIPARFLKNGENTIVCRFKSPVSASGSAVTMYMDREDGSEYVYTLFVPSDASTAFPCFDQPDLKAKFRLNITVSKDWRVISNTAPESVDAADDGAMKRWQFGQTRPISTYLFAFAAGPFAELTDNASTHHTHLYARKSRLERARNESSETFRITREGLDYFIRYFDFEYPFPKYDLVLIPEFAYGGMEHAGATFLNEDGVLFPTEPTANSYLSRAELILHETAHQWFGDLVTMRWFDDLWLKEGFATFMGTKAAEKVMPQYDTWKAFYLRTKPAAYATDSTKGTTPIWQQIPNLSAAKSAYGNIVYNKAPSMLHQAEFYLGADNFQRAIQLFVKQHAYANATWSDLVGDFEKTSDMRLTAWADAWVKHRGMPDVHVDWTVGGGRITSFKLSQTDVLGEGGVWPMKLKVLLAYDGREPEVLTVTLNGKEQIVKDAIGRPIPAYVFANYQDYAYGQFLLDARSQPAVIERLGAVKDDFLRALLWGSLWDSVRQAELPPGEYLKLGTALVGSESDEVSASSILGRMSQAFNRYLSASERDRQATNLESMLQRGMTESSSKGMRIIYFRSFLSAAITDSGLTKLKQILSGASSVQGMPLRTRDKFDIVSTLLERGDSEGPALLEAESQAEKSDEARRYTYATGAARALPDVKKKYFDDYLHNREIPESWIAASLGPFNSSEQSTLTLPYLEPALAALPQMKRTRKIFFVNGWLGSFIGGQCSEMALSIVNRFLENKDIDRDLRLKILENEDGLARCVRIHRKYDGRPL